jgi:hypothetical protein
MFMCFFLHALFMLSHDEISCSNFLFLGQLTADGYSNQVAKVGAKGSYMTDTYR